MTDNKKQKYIFKKADRNRINILLKEEKAFPHCGTASKIVTICLFLYIITLTT